MNNPVDTESGRSKADLLRELADEVARVLSVFGTLSLDAGDYWMGRINLSIPSVEVLIFQTENFVPDILMECSTLLDAFPEDFRIRFIEAERGGEPLKPLSGMSLNRYGAETIG